MIIAHIAEPSSLNGNRNFAAAQKRELAHFEICPMCQQAVDRRDIHAVMHHLPVGHEPLPVH